MFSSSFVCFFSVFRSPPFPSLTIAYYSSISCAIGLVISAPICRDISMALMPICTNFIVHFLSFKADNNIFFLSHYKMQNEILEFHSIGRSKAAAKVGIGLMRPLQKVWKQDCSIIRGCFMLDELFWSTRVFLACMQGTYGLPHSLSSSEVLRLT